jgi:hypothetical protein
MACIPGMWQALLSAGQFRKRFLSAGFEDCGALAPGYVPGNRESRSCLILIVAVKRQEALAAQTIDFRQIKAHARFIDGRHRAIKVSEAVRSPAGGQQNFGSQAQIILRHRAGGCRPVDFGIE